ncbi:unnamed protein product [Parnassius apollo]|uniref:(apollo) hypothetical protein n=1 Tax=Parnassius apollo TaxID=110799 RepID=A0A8S3XCW1_PARAO|nr:unnamed protein product [Parnassius apollo]
MASSRQLRTDEIASFLENTSDSETCDTDSGEEDCMTYDEVRSDVEDEVVDSLECSNESASQETLQNDDTSIESTNTDIPQS